MRSADFLLRPRKFLEAKTWVAKGRLSFKFQLYIAILEAPCTLLDAKVFRVLDAKPQNIV